jgi:hypothetical protein
MSKLARGLKSFLLPHFYILPSNVRAEMPSPRSRCLSIKNKKKPDEQCIYTAKRGNFCSRHLKNPILYIPPSPRYNLNTYARKIQGFWKARYNRALAKERGPGYFIRSLCHNETELASFEPLENVPNVYFFTLREGKRIWGFDIRTLVFQYEEGGKLENPYTKEMCPVEVLEKFKRCVDKLKKRKMPLHYEHLTNLTPKQSWNLRVLDICLQLDMLGYRIATHWFADLSIEQQKRLYSTLYNLWNSLPSGNRNTIVPVSSELGELFKWVPEKIQLKTCMDSVRRTNLNVIERMISSASQQSDRTLGAMYCVISLTNVSYRCRNAYPWLAA